MAQLHELKTVTSDNGNLTVFEGIIPGIIQRVFYIYEAGNSVRAGAIRLELSCIKPGYECALVDASEPPSPPIQVLTVCDALMQRDQLYQHKMVLIAILDRDRLRLV